MTATTCDDLNLNGPEELADPAVSAKRLLSGDRCRYYERFEPPFYILSRYEDVSAALRNTDVFLSGHGQGPNFAPPVGVVSDAPQHTFFRQLVQHDFLPRSIAGLQPRLEEIARELLDAVADRDVWDLHDDLSFPLPVTIICEIFGIPTDDVAMFKRWSDASVAALSSQNPAQYEDELARMRAYVLNLLRTKRQIGPDRSLLSRVAHAKQNGLPVSDEEAVGLVLQLFVAGNETTTSLISNFVWRLLSNEGLWDQFTAGQIDTDQAINESLRFDPPLLGLFRTTATDVEFGDMRIPAHTKVMMHYGAANRDPDAFPDPNTFDVHRKGRKVLSFGLGIHVCLGMELAKLEARVTLNALRDRYPCLRLVDDGERVGPFLFWGRRKLPVRHARNR